MSVCRLTEDQSKWFLNYVNEYSDNIQRFLMYLVGDRSLVEDLFQEVLLKAARYVDRLENLDGQELQWYTRAIIRSVVCDYFRKQKKEIWMCEPDWKMIRETYNAYKNPENHILSQEYRKLFDILKPKYREVLYLRISYGMPFSAIGKSLGIKETAARKRFERGKKILEEKYGKEFLYEFLMLQ